VGVLRSDRFLRGEAPEGPAPARLPLERAFAAMRIAFIVYGSIDQVTGGYLYDRRVISALRSRGWSVEVFGLRKIPYLLSPLQGLSPALRSLLRGGERRRPFDFVVVDELVHPSVRLALGGGRPGGIVTLVHHLRCRERFLPPARAFAALLERALLNRSELIITTGARTAGDVRPLLGRQVPVLTCAPGRDALPGTAFPRRAPPRGGRVRILSVGILVPRKGHHLLIEALSNLRGLDWECTIAGDDSVDPRYAARLRGLVDRSGLGARVRVAGRVSGEELAGLFRGADVFAFPSELEGYGIALAEAMGFGLPYAALSGGALAEITGRQRPLRTPADGRVLRAEGGLVAEDRSAFGWALGKLVEDEGLRRRLSREAGKRARGLPTWEDTGRCFAEALLGAASGGALS
jgi:glycosyltransferase involved in cell wall biosynthesis